MSDSSKSFEIILINNDVIVFIHILRVVEKLKYDFRFLIGRDFYVIKFLFRVGNIIEKADHLLSFILVHKGDLCLAMFF